MASRDGRGRDYRRSAHPHFEFLDLLAYGHGIVYDRRLGHLLHVMREERAHAPAMGPVPRPVARCLIPAGTC